MMLWVLLWSFLPYNQPKQARRSLTCPHGFFQESLWDYARLRVIVFLDMKLGR